MSIMDSLKQMAGSEIEGQLGGAGAGQSGMIGAVTHLLENPQVGGLGGLVQMFQSHGLGEAANSWVGTGQNQPVTGQQVQQVLGQDRISSIASHLGIAPEAASSKLATFLPMIIDKLTPNGHIDHQ